MAKRCLDSSDVPVAWKDMLADMTEVTMANDSPEPINRAIRNIALKRVMAKVSSLRQWSRTRTIKAEKTYRKALRNFALGCGGNGRILSNDVLYVWQAHCQQGKKYAHDMESIVDQLFSKLPPDFLSGG